MRLLAAVLTAMAVLWTATVLSASTRALRDVPLLVPAAYAAGALICHQRPERSFHANRIQFPVCARCTGLYVSGALGALAAWFGVPRVPRRVRGLVAVAALPTALTVGVEWAGAAAPSNVARAATSLPLGAAAGWVVVRLLRAEGSRRHAL